MKYKSGYKYVLTETFGINIPLYHQSITTSFIVLDPKGNLVLKEGYAWDGATFFPDLEVVKRGSLVHDALCQLLRLGSLHSGQLNLINSIFVDLVREDVAFMGYTQGFYHTLPDLLLTALTAIGERARGYDNPVKIAPALTNKQNNITKELLSCVLSMREYL